MISIIIPYMKHGDYEYHLERCIDSLKKQTASIEIIVSKHEPEKYIRKNYLLNEGLKRSSGNIIWHCDADFTLEDMQILEKMSNELDEVIYPVFYSPKYKKMKIADGGLMIKRCVLEKHGPLNESAIGINYVTFPILKWCMNNTNFEIRKDFIVTHNKGGRSRIDYKVRSRLKPIHNSVVNHKKYEMFDLPQ